MNGTPSSFNERLFEMAEPIPDLAHAATVIAIDPGLQGTGFARWSCGKLTDTHVFTAPRNLTKAAWPTRAESIVDQILCHIPVRQQRKDAIVLCEMMEYQGGGARGLGWRSGDMQRTTFFTGLIAGEVFPAYFVPVPVSQWKGQLPKTVVIERLRKRLLQYRDPYPTGHIISHAWDAVGIGLWAMGRF